ncbi:MAG: hypothetical protein A2868_02255 [Candidatus Levybacteria bacterium RIFCSPHIGHO2_01_FULL_40_15b]|nr:MAG: hypothetical protein A2868_02255 [Candidatus Levybacteria bacterium RIFCSPHIGHO2_01_FULL_40_15b]
MLDKIRKTLFFVIVFFLSSQVGLHFWPEFAKVSGIRIDYLSPTLYLLDILIIAWIVVWAVGGIRGFRARITSNVLKVLLSLLGLSLFWNILNAESIGAHIFGIVKLAEFGLFGWLVVKTFEKKDISVFVRVLALSAIVSSLLSIWQFIKQSSVGGLWYFFGERTFNISTIGISTVNLDQQILRPYAVFPHPNVLAFFFLVASVFTILRLPYEKSLAIKTFLILSITLSTVGLFLTFSRIIILLAICFFIYAIYAKGKRNAILIVLGLLGLFGAAKNALPGGDFFTSAFLLRGIDFRQELLAQSFQIFLNNPYFGIGLNNFFIHQSALIKDISPILFQPPHNIFVIALLSLGIFGWWIIPYIFIRAIRAVREKVKLSKGEIRAFYRSILFILISIMIVGMFDHFFLTLEQGQIMLALVLGLSFADLRRKT